MGGLGRPLTQLSLFLLKKRMTNFSMWGYVYSNFKKRENSKNKGEVPLTSIPRFRGGVSKSLDNYFLASIAKVLFRSINIGSLKLYREN